MLKKNKILPFGQANANLPETSENNELIDNSIIHWDTLPTIEEITTTAYTSDGLAIDFTHPGIFVNSEHLHTMREMIHEGYDPWFSAFEDFRVLPRASRDFVPRNVNRIATYISKGDRVDAQAAYSQAVMWWVTGDRVYHDNAIDILRLYIESYDPYMFATMHPGYSPSGVWTGGYGWSAEIITAGMIIQYFSFAAEILRYAEPGEYLDNRWTDEDTEGFLDLLEMTFPIYDRVIKWMNQDSFTFQGMIASAIFQNDADMLVTAIERATVNSESPYTFASGSIKWQMREVTHTACIESFNRGDFPVDIIEVEPQIQVAEMGRQQAYGLVNVELLQSIAQMAHVQGIMINEQGQIVTDGSGTNLFNFLDNRLLQGSNYYFRHNLGYDVLWHPIAKGNSSDFAELQPIRGTENTPGWWVVADHGNRFRLGAAGVLYNYYLYEEEWDRDHEWLRYVVQAHEFSGDLWSGDSINETNMLIAHPDRQTGVAQGPPQRIEAPTYDENVLGSDRIQFTDYTGAIAHRQTSLRPSRIPLQDEQGLRQVLNNLFAGDFIWFQDIDLTGVDVKNFILRFGSNQGPSGAGFRLLLLDDVEVADWNNLTRAEIDQGTVLVDSTMPTTGWWSNFETEVYEMSQSLNGVHSVAFLLTSSSNAFQLTEDMDWFSFGNFYAYESNSLTTATFTNGITIDGNGRSVLEDGAIFGFE